jgi:hypothetical protein
MSAGYDTTTPVWHLGFLVQIAQGSMGRWSENSAAIGNMQIRQLSQGVPNDCLPAPSCCQEHVDNSDYGESAGISGYAVVSELCSVGPGGRRQR